MDKSVLGVAVVALTLSLVDAFLYASWFIHFAAICLASITIGFLIGAWGFRWILHIRNRQQ